MYEAVPSFTAGEIPLTLLSEGLFFYLRCQITSVIVEGNFEEEVELNMPLIYKKNNNNLQLPIYITSVFTPDWIIIVLAS